MLLKNFVVTTLLIVGLCLTFTPDPVHASSKTIVCYYASWAHYRTGAAKYTVEDVPVEMCTHVIYAFAVLDSNTLTAVEHNADLDKDGGYGNYRRFLQLRQRNPEVKVRNKLLLGLGGWEDSRSEKYSQLVSSPKDRANFISHIVRFLKDYGFDGLDLDWEYPAYQSSAQDKEGFSKWVQELRKAFNPHGLLLTAAVSAGRTVIDRGYDVPAVAKALDQIHIMAYDFHGPWEGQVAHHAPLFPAPEQSQELSADFAVKHWIKKGAPPSKLVLGVPFYGKSWTLAGSESSVGSAGNGAGKPGPLMKTPGTLAYYELCLAHKVEGWRKFTTPAGPYLTVGNQWVGYDDVETIRRKSQYVNSEGLGGIMIWDITMDDFRASCSNEANPLTKTIYSTLVKPTSTEDNTLRPRPSSSLKPVTSKPDLPSTSRPLSRPTTPRIEGKWNAEECFRTGYTADTKNCSYFIRCTSNQAYHLQCPSKLFWNQAKRSCDWYKSSLCNS